MQILVSINWSCGCWKHSRAIITFLGVVAITCLLHYSKRSWFLRFSCTILWESCQRENSRAPRVPNNSMHWFSYGSRIAEDVGRIDPRYMAVLPYHHLNAANGQAGILANTMWSWVEHPAVVVRFFNKCSYLDELGSCVIDYSYWTLRYQVLLPALRANIDDSSTYLVENTVVGATLCLDHRSTRPKNPNHSFANMKISDFLTKAPSWWFSKTSSFCSFRCKKSKFISRLAKFRLD